MAKRDLKLYCFSPFVMLATFVVEIALALYAIFRYRLNEVGRVAVATFVFLAIFQLAEYNVCETGWVDSVTASRIGYVAITMLPPLGIHLAYALGGVKKRPLLWPAYLTGVAFAAFFLLVPSALSGHTCLGNYVIFQMAPGSSWLYGLYYYGWMLLGIWLCWHLAKPKTTLALYGLAIGYLAFIVPTTTANLVDPKTLDGIPSIMCGFAVLFALTLAFWILPKGGEKH
ncbi:MAG TPA: hypothetical protein VM581_01520 [Magnetospirillaceae bacterium]|nr:hypothetical protein [Magnetospirillaceae bacterium]